MVEFTACVAGLTGLLLAIFGGPRPRGPDFAVS